jgi:glyoxylase-like metal-dependent hydrolase (beta-lactamase superfamily II)
MKEVKLYLGYAGFCEAKESHSIRGEANRDIKFHALFGLIQHPEKGWILYDTGYTKRFYAYTKSYPNKLYAKLTKVFVTEEDEIKNQLKHFGIKPTDIKHIIITHFHADHVA